jgi:hypothetical protein
LTIGKECDLLAQQRPFNQWSGDTLKYSRLGAIRRWKEHVMAPNADAAPRLRISYRQRLDPRVVVESNVHLAAWGSISYVEGSARRESTEDTHQIFAFEKAEVEKVTAQ